MKIASGKIVRRDKPIKVRMRQTSFHKLWGIDPNIPASAKFNERIAQANKELKDHDDKVRNLAAFGMSSPKVFK